jgi:hypothetical protein
MPAIYLTRSVVVNGEPHAAGDVVSTSEADALYLVRGGRARWATADDLRRAPNPRPAAEVRRLLQAEATKGGPRPQRRG